MDRGRRDDARVPFPNAHHAGTAAADSAFYGGHRNVNSNQQSQPSHFRPDADRTRYYRYVGPLCTITLRR
jgi:hypothetical protein